MNKDNSQKPKEVDQYTANVLQNGISRRSFLTRAAVGTGGLAFAGLAGTASAVASEANQEYANIADATLGFMPKPKVIAEKDIASTQTFDVIVVGAGASGVPAALSAAENGAKVAVLQKQAIVVAQGNTGSGIDLKTTPKASVEAMVSRLMSDSAHRCHPELLRSWAYNSGEAISWVIDRAKQGGAQVVDQGTKPQHGIHGVSEFPLNFVTSFFGPKPYTAGDGMRDLAKTAEKAGVKFFFNMPAQQLIQDESGKVIGVIAQSRDGKYHKYMAKKGVILSTGDYQNNKAMSDYFIPDIKNFERKQMDRTGDGFAMAFWAGGVIEPIGHTKMLHDFDAGPASMCDMPFLAVNRQGERFVNETVEMSLMNNYLRDEQNAGHYSQVFDSDYMTQAANWPGHLYSPEELKVYMPDDPTPKKGVFPSLTNTHVADTLEELAVKLECDPKTFVANVKRYNELCKTGQDDDFGKRSDRMVPVLKAPFYGIHRRMRVSAICSGMLVNKDHQALDADGKPIEGLYVIGNLGGGFYGGVDYPLTVFGLSLGRCYTFGYLTGKHVAKL
ncbi:FAD-dependent oxidoreductase [Shewanella baltica]|uniref:FAD-dependent oxidoreductase n=1 Tax=Shewanella baltica TaxID=62322 RepID=UPI00014F86F3|nr:FAD-binding protein [Shewanella baltica]ABS07309.1 fumarate reductase/succinate dehydrogenase flavoprotein domain protein [Shewanella baltica OS185]AVT48701.1 FAD-binding protein [Shewanella baltica]MCS6094662.1 FAD-binding protein [Shewanella baltica]MCS6117373.1 FAD-binding protein [Shewanella baltica]MCS6158573.1 FAD-binding protein [Shewanella baltica]